MGNAILGTLYMVGLACADRPAARHRRRRLPRRARRRHRSATSSASPPRCSRGVPSHRHRHRRLRPGGRADAALLGAGRRGGAGDPDDAARWRAPPRRWCGWCPHSLREASLALGRARVETSLQVVLRTALGGIVTAGAARRGPRRRRDRAAALHRAQQPVLERRTRPAHRLADRCRSTTTPSAPTTTGTRKAWAAALVLLLAGRDCSTSARACSRVAAERASHDRMKPTRAAAQGPMLDAAVRAPPRWRSGSTSTSTHHAIKHVSSPCRQTRASR